MHVLLPLQASLQLHCQDPNHPHGLTIEVLAPSGNKVPAPRWTPSKPHFSICLDAATSWSPESDLILNRVPLAHMNRLRAHKEAIRRVCVYRFNMHS
jgi:hypothetical protein